jgi:putative (di)nucleoside polyphosphate hydrolase
MSKEYRKCVGMMILNTNNEILVGRRIDYPSGYWQMPQGGIDKNEKPEKAVFREMMEEIGTNNVKLINISAQWINYNIPEDTLKTLPWGQIYIGQRQKWFIFRFKGKNNEIDVGTENPEFSEWKWLNHKLLLNNAVPFKRDVYEKVLKEFKDFF